MLLLANQVSLCRHVIRIKDETVEEEKALKKSREVFAGHASAAERIVLTEYLIYLLCQGKRDLTLLSFGDEEEEENGGQQKKCNKINTMMP